MNIDLMSVSGHKIHGPKGVGFLYVNEKTRILPILFGGGQQNNLRSGTENVPGIAGMAMAAEMLYKNYDEDVRKLYAYKGLFIDGVERMEGIRVNGLMPTGFRSDDLRGSLAMGGRSDDLRINGFVADSDRMQGTAPHVVSVSFRGVRSEVLLHALEERGIYVSAGSACSARKPQPSATLRAMGLEKDLLESTIRFSFSVFTTREEIEYTLSVLNEIVPRLRMYTRKR